MFRPAYNWSVLTFTIIFIAPQSLVLKNEMFKMANNGEAMKDKAQSIAINQIK